MPTTLIIVLVSTIINRCIAPSKKSIKRTNVRCPECRVFKVFGFDSYKVNLERIPYEKPWKIIAFFMPIIPSIKLIWYWLDRGMVDYIISLTKNSSNAFFGLFAVIFITISITPGITALFLLRKIKENKFNRDYICEKWECKVCGYKWEQQR